MEENQIKPYSLFFNILNKASNFIAGLIAVALLVVVVMQIGGRWLGSPSPWTEEMTRYLFIWMIFIGVGLGFRKAESPRVTVFLNWMPSSIQKLGRWTYIVGSISFLLFMVIYGVHLVHQQVTLNETSSVLLIPVWLVGISVPISGVLGILNIIQSLIYHKNLI
ncbi:TRAP transporter small permease [Oceanobacillus timonensis]|uniref:TRAP transporter small permease n=1 Tax=Oceanobacillus timonensis TaxID=1926285 RepID=UPI0009BBBAAB|nr:TRAP transporter small permease [Oceanobacillus timonensis]